MIGRQLKRHIKIGVISEYSLNDRKSASGTHYKVMEMLRDTGAELVWLQPNRGIMWKLCCLLIRIFHKLMYHKSLDYTFTRIVSYQVSHSIDKNVMNECDVVVSSFSSNLCYKLPLRKEIPLVYITDAVWYSLLDYYLFDYSSFSVTEGNKIEKYVLDRANAVIVSSDWCKNDAVGFYGILPEKCHVIPFGANIDDEDIKERISSDNERLNILFMGVDWKRKGGDIALAAINELNNSGTPAVLYIVGAGNIPEEARMSPYVNYVGMLDKNKREEYDKLIDVVRSCDIMLLPTVAECCAIAFCECSAFGIPVYTHDTGGVSSVVKEGVNGRLLPLGTSGEEFAMTIKKDLCSGKIREMSDSAKEYYKERLNWNVWRDDVVKIINELI